MSQLWSQSVRRMRREHYVAILGTNPKEPKLEDFNIDDEVCAKEASERNKRTAEENKSLYRKRGPIEGLIPFGKIISDVFFPIKEIDDLGLRYEKYVEAVTAYAWFLEDQEDEAKLDIERKKKDYWFSLSGHEFEEEIRKLFEKSGYFSEVIKTKGSGDGGIDLILIDDAGNKVFVQCKAHKNTIGPHVVRDLYGAMQAGGASQGIIISLGGITTGVREFMNGKNINAVDVDGVLKMQQMLSE